MSTATEELAQDHKKGQQAESEKGEEKQQVEPYWPWPPLL
jgi:hypothetical protein